MSLFFPKDEAPGQLLPDPGPQGPPGPTGPQGPAGASTWDELTGKPTSFAPSAHKSTHATGGSDAITPSDIGALPDTIVVSGAGTVEANGTYTLGAPLNGFKAWYLGENFRIKRTEAFGNAIWTIHQLVDGGETPLYSTALGSPSSWPISSSVPLTPVGLTFLGNGGILPVPTVRATHNHAIADTIGLQTALDFSTAITSAAAPITAGSVGSAGSIRYDSSFLYICTATNTWRRTAITSW